MQTRLSALCAAMFLLGVSAYPASGAGMRRTLTPEERIMYMQDQRGPNWRDLSLQQRCERHWQMRRAWASMNPAGLQKLKQQLDARWNALPAAEKQRLEQRIADRSAGRQQTGPRTHQGRCASFHAD